MTKRKTEPKQQPDWFDLKVPKAPGLLVDYYNMQLTITQEDGWLSLSDEEFGKVTKFFTDCPWLDILPPITGNDFDEKFPNQFNNFVSLKQIYEKTARRHGHADAVGLVVNLIVYGNRQSGRAWPYFQKAMWRDSAGFQDFLSDYQQITGIIEDFVERSVLKPGRYKWLKEFGKTINSEFAPGYIHRPKSGNWGDMNACYTDDGSVDLTKADMMKVPKMSGLATDLYYNSDFRLSDFGRLVYLLYQGLDKLLLGEIDVKACKFCYCGKIFLAKRRRYEHEYCSDACRMSEDGRPKCEELACYIGEWLQTQDLNDTYTAKKIVSNLETFVRERHEVDFVLNARNLGGYFQAGKFNRYLERQGFKYDYDKEGRRPYLYQFKPTNDG